MGKQKNAPHTTIVRRKKIVKKNVIMLEAELARLIKLPYLVSVS